MQLLEKRTERVQKNCMLYNNGNNDNNNKNNRNALNTIEMKQ
jgi:hypothetical protein